jgi:hypothetical protein
MNYYAFFAISITSDIVFIGWSDELYSLDESIELLGIDVRGLRLLAIEVPEAFIDCFVSFL